MSSYDPLAENDRLDGKVVVVTGANSGVGFHASRIFAQLGARVVLACRTQAKAEKAMEEILRLVPDASVSFERLDVSDNDSVREFSSKVDSLDVLLLNAGIMALPAKKLASDNKRELQWATNVDGHFLLTSLLLPKIKKNGRVVGVASVQHRYAKTIRFDDIDRDTTSYSAWNVYQETKLANLLISNKLARLLESHGNPRNILACCSHPGVALTGLPQTLFLKCIYPCIAQSGVHGSYPLVMACAGSDPEPGCYVGPRSSNEYKGAPFAQARQTKVAQNVDLQDELWTHLTERLGAEWDFA